MIEIKMLYLFQANIGSSSAENTAGRNAVMTSLLVCCGFIVCFTPFHLLVIINLSVPGIIDFGSWYHLLTVVLMMANSFINPFICSSNNDNYYFYKYCYYFYYYYYSVHQPFHLRRQVP